MGGRRLAARIELYFRCFVHGTGLEPRGCNPDAAAYGGINNIRIASSGPDWVLPGESALAALGLMSAAQQLRVAHQDTSLYDGVLSRFFQTWLLQNRLEWDVDSRDSDFGGMARLVFYEKSGH